MADVRIDGKMIRVVDNYADLTPGEAEKLADRLRQAAKEVRGANAPKPKPFWGSK